MLAVVATSNIVAEWVRAVGQDRIDVFSLLPPNADPHTYQPGAQDIARVADADLVFSVGLSLEGGWLDDLVENAASEPGIVYALGETVDPIDFVEIVEDHHEGEGDAGTDSAEKGAANDGGEELHGELDPHFWFDPLRVKQAVNSIAARLSAIDPSGQTVYRENAAGYNGELDGLHAWIEEQVAMLPEDRRVLVTSHDSFQYFALRYGFEVAGAIFPVTTGAEPTAQDLAELIEIIEHEGVPAVFTEKSHSERLAAAGLRGNGRDLDWRTVHRVPGRAGRRGRHLHRPDALQHNNDSGGVAIGMTATTSIPPLAAEAITVEFEGIKILDGVSFSAGPGCIMGVVGPNGAGKSTLFNVITASSLPPRGGC